MRELNSSLNEDGELNADRRFLLTGLAAAYAAHHLPSRRGHGLDDAASFARTKLVGYDVHRLQR